MQLIPFSEGDANKLVENSQIDSLLRHLGSLSRALHSFIQTNDLHKSIHLALTEILFSIYTKGRAYIMEYGDGDTLSCTYEVCSKGIAPVRDTLQNIPLSTLRWSTGKIQKLYPILINNLDELPLEAAEEKRYLKKRGARSLIMIPLIIKGVSWGYLGIDIVDNNRMWSLEDYQWLSSITNIISIITKMARINEALDHSEKILRNIYKNLPAGIELYDKDGYLVDINDKELEIFGLADKGEVLGVSLFDNPNIPQEIKEKLRAQEDVNFSISYDFSKVNKYIKTHRKGIINLTTKVTTLYDSQNQFINYLFINIDTTETTNAYTKIQEFENLFLLIGDYANVGFAHFNVLTRDGYAQDTWYRNLGEKEGTPMTEVIGVYSHVHPEDQAVLKIFVRGVREGKATSLRKEVRICRENGEIYMDQY